MRLRPRPSSRARPSVPAEVLECGPVVLRRLTVQDAEALSAATRASLDHLRPWMPWASSEGTSVEAQRRRLLGLAGAWTPASGYEYGVFLRDGRLVGGCGLHRRIGPAALEIGYWVHVDHVRRGIATAAAAALTDAALSLRGVERVEIHCDEANHASAAVPPLLGYQLERRIDHPPEAPGETGTRMVWVVHRRQWQSRPARQSPS